MFPTGVGMNRGGTLCVVGGRIYDHIGLKKEEGFVSLEIIRSDYENQMWNKIISAE